MINLNPNSFPDAGIWCVTGIQTGRRPRKKDQSEMFMKIRMLAVMAALLAGAGFSRADNITNINIWDYNSSVLTCSYGPLTGSSGNYQYGIDGTQLAWAVGSMGGTIYTDGTGTDPTLQLGEQIDNDTGSTWNDYHVTITMSQSFSFSNVGVTNSGWTPNTIITAPVQVGSDWIGYIDYYAGTPVPNGGTLDFNLSITFTGTASFEEDLMPSTVPEPGTFALMVCGLTGLLVMRRRSAMK
jgi:hypothetical protein